MFYYIKGELVLTEPMTAVVDCGGVGYKLRVSDNTLAKLYEIGKTVKLYTYFYVKEETVELIGFYTLEELNAFKMLITVSGVGPKVAMSVLSLLSVEKFAAAVSSDNTKLISKAQGVGAKTAARIVLELKDKVSKQFASADSGNDTETATGGKTSPNMAEAEKALMVLGYSKQEAAAALSGLDGNDTLENLVTAALRRMSSHL